MKRLTKWTALATATCLLLPVQAMAQKCGTVELGTPGINCAPNTNPIYAFLGFVINWATGIIAALAVLAIVISGIQYITSQGSPDALKGAKSRLVNAVVGLILLGLMRVILMFLGVI